MWILFIPLAAFTSATLFSLLRVRVLSFGGYIPLSLGMSASPGLARLKPRPLREPGDVY